MKNRLLALNIDDENMEEIGVGSTKKFYVRPLAQEFSFYITGEIGAPENYTDWFQIIRNASPEDVIKLHINSRGGNASTAIQFIRAMDETPAHIHASVEGDCMSAATVLFFRADSITVSDHSSFMFHDYSGAAVGKGGEMYDAISHGKTWSEKFLRSIYKDFLTEAELQSIFANKDIYMGKDEVMNRIEEMKKRAAEQKEAEPPEEPTKKPEKASKKK